jgi:3-oxoadipate enol-lactonase
MAIWWVHVSRLPTQLRSESLNGRAVPTAAVNSINAYYEVHGKGESLVLIADQGADHRSWFSRTGDFREHYGVITLDIRGIGKTDRPAERYDSETLSDDVVGLMEHLDIEKTQILGESPWGLWPRRFPSAIL